MYCSAAMCCRALLQCTALYCHAVYCCTPPWQWQHHTSPLQLLRTFSTLKPMVGTVDKTCTHKHGQGSQHKAAVAVSRCTPVLIHHTCSLVVLIHHTAWHAWCPPAAVAAAAAAVAAVAQLHAVARFGPGCWRPAVAWHAFTHSCC
jgi:hypothetical protein